MCIRDSFETEREVELQRFFEALLLRVGQHAVGERLGLRRRQVTALEPREMSVYAHLGRRVGRDVKVRAFHRHERVQKIWQSGHVSTPKTHIPNPESQE